MRLIIFVLALARGVFAQSVVSEKGFAVSPIILKHEDCAHDYTTAITFRGLEMRKRFVELERFGCIDADAIGVYRVLSSKPVDLVGAGSKVLFRKVILTVDRYMSSTILVFEGHRLPDRMMYSGWIANSDFIPLDEDTMKKLIDRNFFKSRYR